jgi:hypothetical protein
MAHETETCCCSNLVVNKAHCLGWNVCVLYFVNNCNSVQKETHLIVVENESSLLNCVEKERMMSGSML